MSSYIIVYTLLSLVRRLNRLCLLWAVFVLHHLDQIWPIDLWEASSVRHKWRQCETEYWALSFSTATSKPPLSYVPPPVPKRLLLVLSLDESEPFIQSSACALRRTTPAHCSVNVSVAVCHLFLFPQIYDSTRCLQTHSRRNVSSPCLSMPWLLWMA